MGHIGRDQVMVIYSQPELKPTVALELRGLPGCHDYAAEDCEMLPAIN